MSGIKGVKTTIIDPMEVLLRLWEKFKERPESRKPRCPYTPDPAWETKLRLVLGQPSQSIGAEAEALWPRVNRRLTEHGIQPGPHSYLKHNDGDPALIRAIFLLARSLPAKTVIETGVAHGVTSRFVLEALELNQNEGHLWSIDLAPQKSPHVHKEIGLAVDEVSAIAKRWTFIRGSSRRRLPPLLRGFGPLDLFIHDSLHTEFNTLFELRAVWPLLRPGGAVVVDDIDNNWAFDIFAKSVPEHLSLVCEAEPVRPDPLRVSRQRKGLFGVIVKNGARPTPDLPA